MKVAIVHYWLVGMRGGERVLESLCALYPDAVIFTHVVDRAEISDVLLRHEIRETFIAKLPWARRFYQKYLPLMPLALGLIDLSEFDLVISSESGPAKGVICRPDAVHICYCHSPMRYIWDHFHVYHCKAGRLTRLLMPLIAHRMRLWDVTTALRVDRFVGNSRFVGQRIKSFYRRECEVIHPPIAVQDFEPVPPAEVGDHYLLAGELVSYKRADLAIEAFTRSGLPLRVIGDGDQRKQLQAMAGPNVTFLGRVSGARLKDEFARCRALVFPGEEDFGMIPVEVMAAGRPVIAFGRGGALDTVVPGVTGVFFDEQTPQVLHTAILGFEQGLLRTLDVAAIVAHAATFSTQLFRTRMQTAIDAAVAEKGGHGLPVG